MAKKTPHLRGKNIVFWDEYTGNPITRLDITDPRDHQVFIEMLETYKSFRFVMEDGTAISVIKELRPSFGNKEKLRPVWYGHKRVNNRLRRKYIGKSENLTYEKLKSVAFELIQQQ